MKASRIMIFFLRGAPLIGQHFTLNGKYQRQKTLATGRKAKLSEAGISKFLLKNLTLNLIVTETFKLTLIILWMSKFVCTPKLCLKKGSWPLKKAMDAEVFQPPFDSGF